MKKLTLLVLISIFFCASIFSQEICYPDAEKVAKNKVVSLGNK